MTSLRFSLLIALRYLWSRRTDAAVTIITVISVIGVAIGVIVLNIVMAVFSGFQTELRNKILGADAHIIVRSVSGPFGDWRHVEEKIRSVPGVRSASAFTQNQALLTVHERSTGLLIRGVEEGSATQKQIESYLDSPQQAKELFTPHTVQVETVEGRVQDAELPSILIGRELSKTMSIFTGGTVSLLAPEVASTPFGLMPRFRRFLVVGTYKSGLTEYESGLAYTNLSSAQQFFRLGDTVSAIEVRVENIDRAPEITGAIIDALGGLQSGFYAQDWTESNRPFFEAMKLEKRVYFVVLLLIIVMASFSIISSLVMIVIEKRKDIAVLRTLGASAASIKNIFRLQGALIGALGVSVGLIGAYLGCIGLRTYGFPIDQRIFQMSTLPIKIELVNFVLVGLSAFAICCVATLYPARRASRLQPTEILRYE